jgi:ABC-2 type transport system permease protein
MILSSLFRSEFAQAVKNRHALLLSVLMPLILLGITDSFTAHLGGSLFVIGLCISYGLASTSIMGYTQTVARDREKGVLQRLRVTPAPTWTIMGTRLAMQAVNNLIIALVVVIVGSLIHHVSLSAGEYGLVLLVSLLGGAVFLSIGQLLVGLVKSADTVHSAARMLYFGLVILGLFSQSNELGHVWPKIAQWTPVGTVMTLFAGVMNLNAWGTTQTLSLVACAGYVIVCAGVGIHWFRWDGR